MRHLLPLLAALLCSGLAPLPTTALAAAPDQPSFTVDDWLLAPVRVHLLSAPDAPPIHTTLTEADIERVLKKVNGIWAQAGVSVWLESLVREEAVHTEFAARMGRPDDLRGLLTLRPEASQSPEMFHLYYIKQFSANGVYLGEAMFVKDTAQLRPVEGGIDEPLPRVSSHEIGHALSLPHCTNQFHLMFRGTTGTNLDPAEITQARAAAVKLPFFQTAKNLLEKITELERAGEQDRAASLRAQRLSVIPRNLLAPAQAVAAATGVPAATGAPAAGAAPAQPRPALNILWLIAEDLGPHLGCYGTREVWTPNLDRLAAEGVRYTHFYNGMVCSVSRSSFMTGMYATSIGAHNHRTTNKQPLPEGVRTLCDWLRREGYFTANLRELPAGVGFKGTGKTDWNFKVDGPPFDSARWSDLKSHQPFYAQINFSETHRPFSAPGRADPARVEIPPYYPDHPVTRRDWAQYLDEATEVDRKIGLVLQALDRDGLADNTLVVFFGDNGQAHVRGKQFLYEEGQLVPLIIRWPKNLPAPTRLQPGTVDERFLHGIDLAPTMLALAGAAKPSRMQGRIFLGEHTEPDREYIFGHRDRCDMTQMRLRSVRDSRYRYIRNFTPWVPFLARNEYKEKSYPVWNLLKELHAQHQLTPPQEFLCQPAMPAEELYDLKADPWELQNIAGSDQPEAQAALKRLRGVLENWITETGDQGRRLETLEELKAAELRFDPALDWRPPPSPSSR